MRVRLDVSYDGTDFAGWADQPGRRTVQGVLEHWLTTTLRLPEPARLTVAGRTDAGVHARGQVCHVDLPEDVDTDQLPRRLRRALPADVVVRRASIAPPGFDARFSAVWRRYVYRLADSSVVPDPLTRGMITVWAGPLDIAAMNACAPELLGLRDFVALCKHREGATTIRTLHQVESVRRPDGVIETTVRADAFCHSMVRSLMGALASVGCGRRDLDWLRGTMAAGTRGNEIPVLAARGLVLEEVGYPPDAEMAARALQARNTRTLDAVPQGV